MQDNIFNAEKSFGSVIEHTMGSLSSDIGIEHKYELEAERLKIF